MRDLAIVGGGPVGLAAALAAANHGMATLVLDAQREDAAEDPRVFALSYGARLILERLGAWPDVAAASPVRAVHVSQRGAIGHTLLHARELGIPALGYVLTQSALVRALRQRAAQLGVERLSGVQVSAVEDRAEAALIRFDVDGHEQEIAARIVAQADGGLARRAHARTTERRYGQCALIANVYCARAARDYAYERFTPHGPIALLPLQHEDGHALIWTVPEAEAERLLGLDAADFERALADAYGERIGAVRLLGARACYPLQLRFVHAVAGTRVALIGNAAQTLHPVAGQGFNMGLRDAYELALALAECARGDEDWVVGLRRYRARRRIDRAGGSLFTDFLVRAFSNDDPVLAAARSAGLLALDAFAPAKRFLMRRMIFGSSG